VDGTNYERLPMVEVGGIVERMSGALGTNNYPPRTMLGGQKPDHVDDTDSGN